MATQSYIDRYPREWRFRIDHLAPAKRSQNNKSAKAMLSESERVLKSLTADETVVVLDEAGKQLTSRAFSKKLVYWQAQGRDLCFVIGGPDGVSDRCRDRADFVLSLSGLTLPHGLARVLLLEQLYRAWSLSVGHPYHRD